MVCAKCQKLSKTTLVTPDVKKRSEIYHGSPASTSSDSKSAKSSSAVGQTGVSKSKLLSKSAKNPYAQYASSCTRCKTKVAQGHTYCHTCAFKSNACAICGKSNLRSTTSTPVISGQKFTLK